MAETAYDCIVIGSGPGGYVAAIRAAQLGKRTAVVENDKVGGRCLNYACIPAKAVLRSADLLSEIRDAERVRAEGRRRRGRLRGGAGAPREGRLDAHLRRRRSVQEERDRADRGRGSLAPGGAGNGGTGMRVRAGEHELAAATVVLATGSVPRAIPGVELGGRVIGTEEAWALPELPARLAVVGAGASGAEIASGFARLGSEVLLLEALDRVLPAEDADISRLVERGLKRQGIDVHTGTPIGDVQAYESRMSVSHGSERGDHRGRLPRRLHRPRAPTSTPSASTARASSSTTAGSSRVDGAQRTSRAGRLRDRRPRAGTSARAQGLRRGDHRRRGCGRAADPPDSSTSTSRARRSALPTSAASA